MVTGPPESLVRSNCCHALRPLNCSTVTMRWPLAARVTSSGTPDWSTEIAGVTVEVSPMDWVKLVDDQSDEVAVGAVSNTTWPVSVRPDAKTEPPASLSAGGSLKLVKAALAVTSTVVQLADDPRGARNAHRCEGGVAWRGVALASRWFSVTCAMTSAEATKLNATNARRTTPRLLSLWRAIVATLPTHHFTATSSKGDARCGHHHVASSSGPTEHTGRRCGCATKCGRRTGQPPSIRPVIGIP